jgi:hypothetical protein
MVPDPAGQFWSPYLGMGNNWMNGVDPDGRDWYKGSDGTVEWYSDYTCDGWIGNDDISWTRLGGEDYTFVHPYLMKGVSIYADWTWDGLYNSNPVAQSVTQAMDKAGRGVFMGGVIIGGLLLAPEAFLLRSIADFSVQMAFNDFNVQESITDMNWMSISSAGLGYVPGSIIGAGLSTSGNGFSSVLDGSISAKQFGVNLTSNLAFRGAAKLYKPVLQSAGTPALITEGNIFMLRVANGTVKRGVRELNGN